MKTRSDLHHALNDELDALRSEGFTPVRIYLTYENRKLLGEYSHYKWIPLHTDRTLDNEFEIVAEYAHMRGE